MGKTDAQRIGTERQLIESATLADGQLTVCCYDLNASLLVLNA